MVDSGNLYIWKQQIRELQDAYFASDDFDALSLALLAVFLAFLGIGSFSFNLVSMYRTQYLVALALGIAICR